MQFLYSRVDAVALATGPWSKFDETLHRLWTQAHDSGQFRYKLPLVRTHTVPQCPLKPLILVLPERFQLRRTPCIMPSLDAPLTGFHFNRVAPNEVLMYLINNNETAEKKKEEESQSDRVIMSLISNDSFIPQDSSKLIVNVSPFAQLHSLLVPEPEKLHNQRLRKSSLSSAIECILLSNNPLLCMGFNSLLALASVNHLHFHIWQTPEPLYVMSADTKVKSNAAPCYREFAEHPVHNFVVELTELCDLDVFIDSIWRVVDTCHKNEIAHNLFITRASDGRLRAILWPRRSVYEAKGDKGYNLAVAELAGMFVVSDEATAIELTATRLEQDLVFERISDELYDRLISNLRELQTDQG